MCQVPTHLMVPLSIQEWLVRHMSYDGGCVFSHKTMMINLNKDTADKKKGFPSCSVPFVLESNNPEVFSEVKNLRKQYLTNNSIPIKNNFITIKHLGSPYASFGS